MSSMKRCADFLALPETYWRFVSLPLSHLSLLPPCPQVVPLSLMTSDETFYTYIRAFNDRSLPSLMSPAQATPPISLSSSFGVHQVTHLKKIQYFVKNRFVCVHVCVCVCVCVWWGWGDINILAINCFLSLSFFSSVCCSNLQDNRQTEIRRSCLKLWKVCVAFLEATHYDVIVRFLIILAPPTPCWRSQTKSSLNTGWSRSLSSSLTHPLSLSLSLSISISLSLSISLYLSRSCMVRDQRQRHEPRWRLISQN